MVLKYEQLMNFQELFTTLKEQIKKMIV